jgi:hypothetical protein
MALHSTPSSMLKESLIESLEAAKFCANYRKTDEKWGEYQTGGCLGYPSAILLFSIIDSIGSYYRKNKDFKVIIDHEKYSIDGEGWEHFKILNSKYFNQSLSLTFIKTLYQKYRNYVIHNSVLGRNAIMVMDEINPKHSSYQSSTFATSNNDLGEQVYIISIVGLLKLCEFAIAEFIRDIDTIVPNSKQGSKFH